MDAPALILDAPRPTHAAQLFGHGQAGLQSVLVESMAQIRAAEPGPPRALDIPELPLGGDGTGVEQRVIVDLGLDQLVRRDLFARVERGEDVRRVWNAL